MKEEGRKKTKGKKDAERKGGRRRQKRRRRRVGFSPVALKIQRTHRCSREVREYARETVEHAKATRRNGARKGG